MVRLSRSTPAGGTHTHTHTSEEGWERQGEGGNSRRRGGEGVVTRWTRLGVGQDGRLRFGPQAS